MCAQGHAFYAEYRIETFKIYATPTRYFSPRARFSPAIRNRACRHRMLTTTPLRAANMIYGMLRLIDAIYMLPYDAGAWGYAPRHAHVHAIATAVKAARL